MFSIPFSMHDIDRQRDLALQKIVFFYQNFLKIFEMMHTCLQMILSLIFAIYRYVFVESLCMLVRLALVSHFLIQFCGRHFMKFKWPSLTKMHELIADPNQFDEYSPWLRAFFMSNLALRMIAYPFRKVLLVVNKFRLSMQSLIVVIMMQLQVAPLVKRVAEFLSARYQNILCLYQDLFESPSFSTIIKIITKIFFLSLFIICCLDFFSLSVAFVSNTLWPLTLSILSHPEVSIRLIMLLWICSVSFMKFLWDFFPTALAVQQATGVITSILHQVIDDLFIRIPTENILKTKNQLKDIFNQTQTLRVSDLFRNLFKIYIERRLTGSIERDLSMFTSESVHQAIDAKSTYHHLKKMEHLIDSCEHIMNFLQHCQKNGKDNVVTQLEEMIASTNMSACVNQPLLAMITLNAFIQIAEGKNLIEQCESAYYLKAIREVESLCAKIVATRTPEQPLFLNRDGSIAFRAETDIEFFNEVLARVHQKFAAFTGDAKCSKWIGVPDKAPSSELIHIFEPDVDLIVKKLSRISIAKDDESLLALLTSDPYAHFLIADSLTTEKEKISQSIEDACDLNTGVLNWDLLSKAEPSLEKYSHLNYDDLLTQVHEDFTKQELEIQSHLFSSLQQKINPIERERQAPRVQKYRNQTQNHQKTLLHRMTLGLLSFILPNIDVSPVILDLTDDEKELFITHTQPANPFEKRSGFYHANIMMIAQWIAQSKIIKGISEFLYYFRNFQTYLPQKYSHDAQKKALSIFAFYDEIISFGYDLISVIFPQLKNSDLIDESKSILEIMNCHASGIFLELQGKDELVGLSLNCENQCNLADIEAHLPFRKNTRLLWRCSQTTSQNLHQTNRIAEP